MTKFDELSMAHENLVELCENLLMAYDRHERPHKPVGAILALAIECIREELHPPAPEGETTDDYPG